MVNKSNGNGLAIEVHGLTKRYGELIAVDHINFDVKRGEFFGFLGPNGAGKTTTIRMLTGIIKGSEGDAKVMGFPAGSVAAKQLSGVMPELSNAYLDLTGLGNLMLVAELYRVPGDQAKKRAETLLKGLGLYERKDSQANDYSMGMRKRLVLCMGLLPDPEILFLDEPTSGLDVQSARFMRGMLRGLKNEGKTIFLTTHNMDEAADMCDRVAIINRGKIVALDSPSNLSIMAGHVYLVDVKFDNTVGEEALRGLPGVSRVETAQAIEAADRMRAMMAMTGGPGMGGGMGGGQRQKMMMQPQMAGSQGASTGMPDRGGGREPMPGAGAGGMSEAMGRGMKEANRFRLYTENTTLLVTSLVDFARSKSIKMTILNVRSPSLEDAFVRLTEEKSREK